MTPKEKVTALALQMVSGNQDPNRVQLISSTSTDAEIMAATGLTKDDLDLYWAYAELVVFKARTKPAVTPVGEALTQEIKSWIDYYERASYESPML
jgi:hypothetical protein